MKEDSLSLSHTLSLSFFKGPKPSYRSACEGRVVLSTRGVAAGVPACVGVLWPCVCTTATAVRGGGCLSVRFLDGEYVKIENEYVYSGGIHGQK